jgi:type I restriction enzyme R subunit
VSSSQFGFLEAEFSELFAMASWAERHALSSPGPAVIYARKTLESGVKWAFAHDPGLELPYEDKLNAYLNSPAFKGQVGGRLYPIAKKIQRAGNRAVHESKPPTPLEAVEVLSALFQLCFWLAFTYGRQVKPDPKVKFDPKLLPRVEEVEQRSLKERQALEARLERERKEAEAARDEAARLAGTLAELEEEHKRLIAEVAAAKRAAAAVAEEEHDWSEFETRAYKIDALLAEAGWKLTDERDREFEVSGMPNAAGTGYVDYVLWGDDGLPLALVEAKRTLVSPKQGQQQAKLYADCLERQFGQRPVIFTSNGYQHWLWDDTNHPPRAVQGFRTSDELQRLIQRRTTAVELSSLDIDDAIADRYYQRRAIRAIAEHIEVDKQRKALVVMATGAGKTRTVVALTDLLMRANLVKRLLFLADRTALVNQAVGAFKTHLPDSAPVNLVTEGGEDGRVYLSTFQTMVGKIDEVRSDGTRRFGVGYFDLVVIDEAHRSVYRKYRGIFEYFDSLLAGLTATPKDEVDKNTYDLFDLETGVPTDAYSLDEAVADGFLVPPRGMSVDLGFMRRGIKYDELSEDEKDAWDELEWGEDEDGNPLAPPDEVGAAELNRFLFNADTVDKVLERLMRDGIRVAGGDRLGKTIIFAKSQAHAEFIEERFNHHYPQHAGHFARVITHNVHYAQSLIDDFSAKDKPPHIAISVDMLDTGLDVPEVVNLVFFKLVRAKTKFWQMIGRGTRLCPDLFGPGDDKTHFLVFDYCQNLEFFSQDLPAAEGSGGVPLSERIFRTRLELLRVLDDQQVWGEQRAEVADILRDYVAAMPQQNFLVRPQLELVERFEKRDAWQDVSVGDLATLSDRVAGLPSEVEPEHEDSKRFDVLVLNTQLAVLKGEPYERERRQIVQIAGLLEGQQAIPAIHQQLGLILDVQTDEWWVDVTHPMLEQLRHQLRDLVPLIERSKRKAVYTDFEDSVGGDREVALPGTGGGDSYEFLQFRKKAQHFLTQHLADDVVAKVRSGAPLTAEDLADLQRILVAAGVGDDASFELASERAGNVGYFVRSLVGLDRAAAKEAFAEFLDEKRHTRAQIEFVNLIIDELTERGTVEPRRVYEDPYVGLAPRGPEDLFTEAELDRLFATLARFLSVELPGRAATTLENGS